MKTLLGNRDKPRLLVTSRSRPHIWWDVAWEPRDLWLGVYWDRPSPTGWSRALDVYICIVPCLPLLISYRRMLPDPGMMAG